MPNKKDENTETVNATENKEKSPKFKVMDPLNPAALNVPKEFDLAEACIDIEGTELGRTQKYMPVQSRKCWYLQNNPKAPMPETEFLGVNDGVVMFKAILRNEQGEIISMAHGTDFIGNYPQTDIADAYLKAETIAIGRCLANRGYGIAFDDGEDNPIDKAKTNTPIENLNQMIENGSENKTDGKSNDTDDFESLSDIDKAVVCLKTGFPIKVSVGNIQMKGEPTYMVAANLKKTGGNINALTSKLQWGIDKGLKGVVNEQYKLRFDVYAQFVLALLNDKELYKAALTAIKTEKFDKHATQNEDAADETAE